MVAPRVEAFLFWPYWHYVWFGWSISASIAALFRCSRETFIVSLMLLAGWFLTTIFWQMTLVYIISDIAFCAMAFSLWLQSREGHILTVVTAYTLMLLVHWIGPPPPLYMLTLNFLYGMQLASITYAAGRRAADPPRGQG